MTLKPINYLGAVNSTAGDMYYVWRGGYRGYRVSIPRHEVLVTHDPTPVKRARVKRKGKVSGKWRIFT